jgi:D-alanine--poly(phosphoribitol) ligase subunit 1
MTSLCLPERVAQMAARRGPAPAVDDGTRVWSYDALTAAGAAIADALEAAGVTGRQVTIGVLADRGIVHYAAAVGIMSSGRIHVPLSPSLRNTGVAKIVSETGCRALIVDDALGRDVLSETIPDVALIRVSAEGKRRPTGLVLTPRASGRALSPVSSAEDMAYYIATSGSTGKPKIVAVSYGNLSACMQAMQARFPFAIEDRVAQCADPGFDVAIGELFLSLLAGACVCPPSREDLLHPAAFIKARGITVWSSVPTVAANAVAMGTLLADDLPSLRLSLFCGEVLSVRLAAAWQRAAPQGLVVNAYGPAETTVFATTHVYDPDRDGMEHSVPIGTPLHGMRCGLDPDGAAGEAVELLLAGPQVTAGYPNDPAATRAVQSRDAEGAIWYRTGDLVIRRPDGAMLWRGRRDHLVKVRGHRTELGVIEAAVAAAASATAAVVLPETSVDGLVTSVVAAHNGSCDEATVRAVCREALPHYMVPRRIFVIKRMPVTLNGKVDRAALADALCHYDALPAE